MLAASWRPVPGRPDAPGVLLLHGFSRERRDFEGHAEEWTERGFSTLALDLRGHGESTRKAGSSAPVRPSPRLLADPQGFPRDVEAACRWLRERAARVGVVGLSVGANLAAIASAARWTDAAVLISANDERLASLAGPRSAAARGALVIAALKDPGREAAAKRLVESALEPRRLLLYPGAEHGIALWLSKGDVREAAYQWLADRLGAVPAATPMPTVDVLPEVLPAMTPTPMPTAPPAPS